MTSSRKLPYDKRSDDEKLAANWTKARKQLERREYSACVMRAATAAEIAANIYIRRFLIEGYGLPVVYVDALIIGVNGLDGKFRRLIRPAAKCLNEWDQLRPLQRKIQALHEHRNGVAHSGKFKDKTAAKAAMSHAFWIIQALAPAAAAELEPLA